MKLRVVQMRCLGAVALAGSLWSAGSALAQSPTAEQALSLTPVQKEVDYDRPSAAEAAKATIRAERIDGSTGWVVRDANGQILRRFVDTNNDNVVDQWCYYLDGIEVYRDIDSNFNNKADQYRWLNTGGTRWGLDPDEDGRIDQWKQISAEEVVHEAVRAMAAGDVTRFSKLLITTDELKSLGLGEATVTELSARIAKAPQEFRGLPTRFKNLSMASWSDSRWVHFSGSRPGLVPAGTGGSTKDLMVYENVVAMIEGSGQNSQVLVGTMVRVDDVWRLIDVPEPLEGGELAATGYFFKPNTPGRVEGGASSAGGGQEEMQKLLAELEQLDKSSATASSPDQLAKLTARRIEVVERLADMVTDADDRGQWIRNLADTINAAVQQQTLPAGVAKMKELENRLAKEADKDLLAYVRFRRLTAEYTLAASQPSGNFAQIHVAWLDGLKAFANEFPGSPDAAEAMMQLAAAEEFAGQDDAAKQWYGQVVKNFPKTPEAEKAAGAITRIDIVGKVLNLKGTNIAGGVVDLAAPAYRGKVVLIHFWATWCGPCKTDMATMRELLAKYGSKGFAVVGISCDSDKAALQAYLQQARIPWAHIYEEGSSPNDRGLNTRLAKGLGVQALPTMLLLDKQGKVVNRNINVTDLDREIGNLLR